MTTPKFKKDQPVMLKSGEAGTVLQIHPLSSRWRDDSVDEMLCTYIVDFNGYVEWISEEHLYQFDLDLTQLESI